MNKLKAISSNTIPELIDGAAVDLVFPVAGVVAAVVAICWSPQDEIGGAGPLGTELLVMVPLGPGWLTGAEL